MLLLSIKFCVFCSFSKDCKKYTTKEYLGTHIYHSLIHGIEGIPVLDPILPSSFPRITDNIKDILSDVGLAFLFESQDTNYNKEITALSDYLRTCTNIVPYKTNILDSITHKLDILTFLGWEGCSNAVEEYRNNKERLWCYLDGFFEYMKNITYILSKNNIPYKMFDLDNDSYTDVFGWDNYIIRKNISDVKRDPRFDSNKWQQLEQIAKEYIICMDDRIESLPRRL